ERGEGRGNCPAGANPLLALLPDPESLPRREAVCDERRLECDDRAPLGERGCHLRADDDRFFHGIAPTCATQRAAASRPSSGPPTRNPAASASPAPVESTASTARAGKSSPS